MRFVDHARRRVNLLGEVIAEGAFSITLQVSEFANVIRSKFSKEANLKSERGDVPGWVLVVLMTTGLVTAIWTIAAPRLSAILRNSLDAMNGIR